MATLTHSATISLDGHIADKDGIFDWAEPDEEVHSFVNQLEGPVGTYLYGRLMDEAMAVWDTLQTHDQPPFIAEFARAFKDHVKVNFFKGASLKDPKHLFNAGLDAKTMRSIDFHQGDRVDATTLKEMVRAAVAHNASTKTRK